MFDAQSLCMQGSSPTAVYGPWFPRGGDYGLFTLDVAKMSSASSSLILTVALYHKNRDDTGDGTGIAGGMELNGSQIATNPRTTTNFTTGFKELVRYVYSLEHAGGSGTNWATFRVLSPVWYDAV